MIHINKGNEPHEWVTEDEFEKRYPEILKSIRERRENKFYKARKKKRIIVRDFAKLSGLTFQEVLDIERGKLNDPEKQDQYIITLNKL